MRKKEGAVLLVGSELANQEHLQLELQGRGFEIEAARRGDEGLTRALLRPFTVVASELRVPGLPGLELLSQLRRNKPDLPVILTTACQTSATAIEAFKLGVFAYVLKPFEIQFFAGLIAKAALSKQASPLPAEPAETNGESYELIGSTLVMGELYERIGRAVASPGSVLIRGATGTGKEIVARAIHHFSQRSKGPFVDLNCNAIPETLFESDLFGHEAGAFTGARTRTLGCFEQAHQGTLFLDEIGDLNSAMQVKLLRALEQKQIRRLGSSANVATDVRVVAATNQDLERRMETGQFRPDLFYRLNAFTIWTPELRTHTQDILPLANAFLPRFAAQMGRATPRLDADALEFLEAQSWPGNVRQLQNVLQYAVSIARGQSITLPEITLAYGSPRPSGSTQSTNSRYSELLQKARSGEARNVLRIVINETECSLLKETIAFTRGNQAQAARCLGMGRATLRDKLKAFGLFPSLKDPNQLDL